jgi:acyl carrier protein phosphodiesterase
MNYLAHAALSFDHPHRLVGNLISDFIKGKQTQTLHPLVQQGISLHRAIDRFTDEHPATGLAKTAFRASYRLYSGAFVDVAYDYFLANDARYFPSEASLAQFSERTYGQIDALKHLIPSALHPFFAQMRRQNWLLHYRTAYGMQQSFEGLVRRSAHLTDASLALAAFSANLPLLGRCFAQLYPELVSFVRQYTLALPSPPPNLNG